MNSSAQIQPDVHEGLNGVASSDHTGDDHNFSLTYWIPYKKEPIVVQKKFCDKAFWVVPVNNRARQIAAYITLHPYFDSFILLIILLNAAFMLIADYDKIKVDGDRSKDSFGELDGSTSLGNRIQLQSDIIFTITFTVEMFLKVLTRGFIGEEGAYFSDYWNRLDALVVVTAWIPMMMSDIPSVSVIRTFRVLRPLKSVSSLPELQKIIVAMLKSIPQLMYVLMLLIFTYTIFGILGLQLFAGSMHQRCRLTPFPVNNSWQQGYDPLVYACLTDPSEVRGSLRNPEKHNVDTLESINEQGYVTKRSSPWYDGKPDCYWPVDEAIVTMCNLNDVNKFDPDSYHCYHGENRSEWTFCGSDFDYFGNHRFKKTQSPPYLDDSIFIEDLLWGYMNFDNLLRALLTIFQSVTMEAWSDIMYICMDCAGFVPSAIYFVLLMLLGSFFALNLVLAVLENSFQDDDDQADDESYVQEVKEKDQREEKEVASSVEIGSYAVVGTEKTSLMRLGDAIQDENGPFSWMITFLIITNTIVLALDKYPATRTYDNDLNLVNLILTLIFAGEMMLKLAVLGVKEYAADRFNCFDAVVVIISFIEMGVSDSSGGLTALRSFRLFRIFKLARKWATMQRLLQLIVTTLVDVSNFLLLVILFIFIYAMLGIEFFANRMHFNSDGHPIPIGADGWEDGYVPRHNFDTVLNAIVTVYQILSGENWNVVMYDGWRATSWAATIYFVTLVIIGSLFVINLFLAILLNNFELVEEADFEPPSEEEKQPPVEHEVFDDIDKIVGLKSEVNEVHSETVDEGLEVLNKPGERNAVHASGLSRVIAQPQSQRNGCWATTENCWDATLRFLQTVPNYLHADFLADQVNIRTQARVEKMANPSTADDSDSVYPLRGLAFGVLGPDHPVRQFFSLIVDNPNFDRTVLALIIISSVLLAVDSPFLDPDGDLKQFLDVMDIVMTILFSVEMLCKFIVLGLHTTYGTGYFQSGWNILDFVVVVVSIVSLTPAGESLRWFKSIRTLRTLRPLRMINRAPGLKVIVNSILASIPEIGNVSAVCLFMFLIFAIFSVNYFKGTLRSCQGDHFDTVISSNSSYVKLLTYPKSWDRLSSEERGWFGPNSTVFSAKASSSQYFSDHVSDFDDGPLCEVWADPQYPQIYPLTDNFNYKRDNPTSRQICECWGGEWDLVVDQRFDDTIWAFLTLFEISTTEGWVDVMWAVVDSRGIDMQPVRDYEPAWVWFFMFFIFMGSYLFLNLFVGVTIDNFNRIKAQKDGESIFMTSSQRLWVDTLVVSMKFELRKDILPPKHPFGQWCFNITERAPNSVRFEKFIMACIVLNTLVMASYFFGQPDEWTTAAEVLNLAFAVIFTLEAVMKMISQRQFYFRDNWNVFDFTIVILTIVGLVLQYSGISNIGSMASIVRTFRVGRAMRLIQGLTEVKRLFKTLMLTLPAVINILTLLVLLFFIFAIVGVQLFATVALNAANDQHTNLRYFARTFIVLLRFSTGENWNGFMHSVARDVDNCVRDPKYDPAYCGYNDNFDCLPLNGCGNPAIYAYMVLFNVIIAFVFVNLFIGVILEGFDQSNDDVKLVHDLDFDFFSRVWKLPQFDPDASCFLPVHLLTSFSRILLSSEGVNETSFSVIRDSWGFTDDLSPSHAQLEVLTSSLHSESTPLKIIDHAGVDCIHFKNVLLAFVKLSVHLHLHAQGKLDDIDQFGTVRNERILKSIFAVSSGVTPETFKATEEHYDIHHRHAAMVIFKAVLMHHNKKHKSVKHRVLRSVETQINTEAKLRPQTPLATAEWQESDTSSQSQHKETSEVSCQTDQGPLPAVVQSGLLTRQLPALPHLGSGKALSDPRRLI